MDRPLGGVVISFDTPETDSIADLALLGIQVNSLEAGGIPFIDGPGPGIGVGNLPSRALGNNLTGFFNGPQIPPTYSEIIARDFEIIFSRPVISVGLNVYGWGYNDHGIQAFDSHGNLVDSGNFSQVLTLNDAALNGFIGIDGGGVLISRLVLDFRQFSPDAVAFDNLTYVEGESVPEPSTFILVVSGLFFHAYKCRDSVDNIPRLWRYLVCQEALEGLPENIKALLKC